MDDLLPAAPPHLPSPRLALGYQEKPCLLALPLQIRPGPARQPEYLWWISVPRRASPRRPPQASQRHRPVHVRQRECLLWTSELHPLPQASTPQPRASPQLLPPVPPYPELQACQRQEAARPRHQPLVAGRARESPELKASFSPSPIQRLKGGCPGTPRTCSESCAMCALRKAVQGRILATSGEPVHRQLMRRARFLRTKNNSKGLFPPLRRKPRNRSEGASLASIRHITAE